MLTAEEESLIQRMLLTSRIILLAMTVGLITFGCVVVATKGVPPLIIQLTPWPLSPVGIFVAVSSLIMSIVVPNLLRNANEGTSGQRADNVKNPGEVALALRQMMVESLVGHAILEGAGFLNLVIAMLGPSLLHLLIGAIIAIFLLARFPVSADQIVANLEERMGTRQLS